TFFTCDSDEMSINPADEIMLKAWRERDQEKRIKAAESALAADPNCPTALILLAEEKVKTITEAESYLHKALKKSDENLRNGGLVNNESKEDAIHSKLGKLSFPFLFYFIMFFTITGKNTNVCVYIRRRLAMCARKLGRAKEAIKMMRDLMKEFPMMSVLNIHENLIEALLEIQAYSEVQILLFPDISLPKSATICYTAALLKARAVCDKFSPEIAAKRGLSPAEMAAVEAIHRAVEFNPHVSKYLLEQKSLVLPPEHILKRGDSEAVAYAFFHLPHWKRVEGAINLLHCTWEGTFRLVPYPLEKGHLFHPYPGCTENADRELLPGHHVLSVYPKKELPFFILFTAGLCSFTAVLALLTHQFPEPMANLART
ncbi:hypothetical protein QZH41_016588, partial [Actinostola sp. cb2023]